jgi:DnaJ family protein C protein 19
MISLSHRFLQRQILSKYGSSQLYPVVSQVNCSPESNNSQRTFLRSFHQSQQRQNELIIGGLALAGGALGVKYVTSAYHQYQAAQAAKPKPTPEETAAAAKEESTVNTSAKAETKKASSSTAQKPKDKSQDPSTSIFASWFARNFYDGGFEEKMSRREAALILGVRESAAPERIKDAHRRILLVNHPDRGGSAHIAAKINEAKDLLLKGKQ